ncbi:MAG TPA: thiamine diphosphokinase [Candidatus Polarisedimenticolaceae bacterium]|nr:thiamine diphosphokinase [Candidatus Polarisedimenticolaceae bacterium]
MKLDFSSKGMRRKRRAAIVALEGCPPADLKRALALARDYDRDAMLVAVDGGLDTCRAVRRSPTLFVGDLDSTRRPPRGVPTLIYPIEKDFSDFAGALDELAKRDVSIVVVAGLLGGRLDHEWANLLEVGSAAKRFSGLLAPSARGLVAVTARGLSAKTTPRRFVSLFAAGRGARVTLRGTWWTLTRTRVAPGSLGLSNVTGDRLSLDVHEGVAVVVFPAPLA